MKGIYFMILLLGGLLIACNNQETENTGKEEKTAEELIEQTYSADPDSLLEVLNDKIAENPQDATLLQERAYHLFNTFRSRSKDSTDLDIITRPMIDIKKAIELDPDNPEYYFSKGYFFHAVLKLQEAEAAFKKAIELDSSYQEAYYFLAKQYLALASPTDQDRLNYDKAREMINKGLKVDAANTDFYLLRGIIYMELGDSGAALSSFKTVTDIEPENYDAYMQQGILYIAAKNPKAEVVLKRALELRPESTEALFALARYHQNMGNYDQAEANYLKTVEIDSMYSIAYLNLGYMYMTYDTAYSKALEYLHKAIYYNPGTFLPVTYYHVARVHEMKENFVQAKRYYKKAVEVDNSFTEAAKAVDRLERKGY